jgi:hypothetical protein
VKQIKLTEKHIQDFMAASKDMAKLYDGANPDKPDPKVEAQAEGVAKKNGFASLAEYDDVSFNISMIMSGIDPQTKKFSEPPEQVKKEIAALKADKSVPDAEKKEDLAQLEAALKNAKPVHFKENIALALKYFEARATHAGAGFEPATCGLEILLALKPDQAALRIISARLPTRVNGNITLVPLASCGPGRQWQNNGKTFLAPVRRTVYRDWPYKWS